MSSVAGQTSITHTLAVSGDTILTLNNPDAPFAPWEGGSNPPACTTRPPVTFRVSSHHLIQASSVFKAALTGCWKEGSTTADGCHEISAEDWDSKAMFVVLSLIHSRTSNIPRAIKLELLSKIAVLVDYYELHEALHFYASIWIDRLRQSLPTVYGRDLMLWVCVSWIFKDAAIFKTVTKLATEESPGKIPTIHLPIPQWVIVRINSQRDAAFSQISYSLRHLKDTLLNGTSGCSFECRSLHLGALIKYMHDDGFLAGEITTASKGRSLKDTVKRVREMKSPSEYWHYGYPSSYCNFSVNKQTEHLNMLLGTMGGLGLYDQ
ncbi:hypothetical protein BT67DRAFT_441030 [Trichocladium antarcticum]|uniref:BTB domain-containing protein n=1 Tax=Trichocladium antarcticum TaxID=1450529 RepID=A0AAN6UM16_9PEZI|nr:hypothetical protein BT67DRAFT_441030 [Trichocladium antarcticum]